MTHDLARDRTEGAIPVLTATFRLRSIPFCPVAQRVMVALAARGTGWSVEEVAGTFLTRPDLPELVIHQPGRIPRTIDKTIAMIEAVEDLHPDQPLYQGGPEMRAAERALMELGRGLQIRLSAVTHAQDSVENDFAIHRLRQRLILIEHSLKEAPDIFARPMSNAGAVFGPTMWRILLVDRRFETYLLTGLPLLARWGGHLVAHPAMQTVLGGASESTYLGLLHQRGTPLVSKLDAELWQPILGLRDTHRGTG